MATTTSDVNCRKSPNKRHKWLLPEPGLGIDMTGVCEYCKKRKEGFVNYHVWATSWSNRGRGKKAKPGTGVSGRNSGSKLRKS